MCEAPGVTTSTRDPLDGALRSLAELPGIAEPGQLATAPDEVHLWYAFSDDARDPELIAGYDELLTDEERARQARFVRDADRDLHRLTRALQRTVLSRYAPVAPGDWVFARDRYDKPAVCGPAGVGWPRFNLSNTAGLVACAVTTTALDPGVDVERIAPRVEFEQLASRFFAPAEAAALRALPPAEHALRFFSYWTLKESHIKACGQGLAMPLDQFAFAISGEGGIAIAIEPALGDDSAAWRHRLFRASEHHLAAVAARVGRGRDLVVRAVRCTPLRDVLAIASTKTRQ